MNLFFFQAEDGIRDGHVTGVQTCALPISPSIAQVLAVRSVFSVWGYRLIPSRIVSGSAVEVGALAAEVGNASCREGVKSYMEGDGRKKKYEKSANDM